MSATTEDVQTTLRLLRAGYPGYQPQLDETTVELWTASLRRYPGPALIAAAVKWVDRHDRFPALAEFKGELRVLEQRAAESAVKPPPCPDCVSGWVEPTPGGGVHPCPTCRAQMHARWQEGAYSSADEPTALAPAGDVIRLSEHWDANRTIEGGRHG